MFNLWDQTWVPGHAWCIAGEAVRSSWDAHHGTLCTGVQWDKWEHELLCEIAQCLGPLRLAMIMRLLVEDFCCGSGEDLCLFLAL